MWVGGCVRGWGGASPQRPTPDFALFAWLESDVTELKEASENLRRRICARLRRLGCESRSVAPTKIKIAA